ncbi:MAG: hypothetical protein M5U34_29145 [Chloroflexi bacterium]|nr:hypothetical protein [Chloroflexota bacterium]
MRSAWDNFTLESDKKWKTFDVELEQRWSAFNRQLRQISEQIILFEETLKEMNLDKKIPCGGCKQPRQTPSSSCPRMWLEEVEKAITNNPNRRRQPALVPIRED